jgi:lipopolysaccharide export system protein LptA
MRRTRWLLLVAIAAILAGVGATYQIRKKLLEQQAPERPQRLSPELSAFSEEWEYTKTEAGRPVVSIRARSVQQASGSGEVQLGGVELRIFHKDGQAFDLVKSAKASFSQSERRLFSEGEVEITLGVPLEGEPTRTLIQIRSSGVHFDSETGKASTDRPADFLFQNGTGKAVGASYDPATHELRLNSQVELNWKAPGAAQPLKLEAAELLYKEDTANVVLEKWARLTRGQSVVNAGHSVVTLQDGEVQVVEAKNAAGEDRYPDRQLTYSAETLWVHFDPGARIRKVEAIARARLVSTSAAGTTAMSGDRVDLEFAEANGEAALARALGTGNAVIESKPAAAGARERPATRILRSNTVELLMRPGGQEIDKVATHAPAIVEFVPNRANDRYRTLSASRVYFTYGARNRIQSFSAAENVVTESRPTELERKKNPAVTKTRSKGLTAEFDPETGQMTRMEQWDGFEYEEGAQRARAARAILESAKNVITLEKAARVWDPSGSTAADRILLNQANGDVVAEGRVTSSRVPEKKQSSGLLSGDEPLQATAKKMSTANRNQLVHYEGDVVLWQGANRLLGQRVDIDRAKKLLLASGNVTTHFREEPKPGAKRQDPVTTLVRAPNLVYSDESRLAHYTGGTALFRGPLQVKAAELRAFLSKSEDDSKLEKAIADGNVEIVETSADRTRRGTGDHGEYYVADEKVILRGGEPRLADSKRGNTQGTELTYYANDDRLLVTGEPGKPVSSRLRRN